MADQDIHVAQGSLTPVAYAVLAVLERQGPATSYELKGRVADGLGPIWSFPHSQLYSEPPKLAARGLVLEQQEEQGRRRRIYTITDAGRDELQRWFRQPTQPGGVRDPALLQLFFGALAPSARLHELALRQEQAHESKLELYESLESELESDPERAHQAQVVRMALLYEELAVDFWSETAARFGGAAKAAPPAE